MIKEFEDRLASLVERLKGAKASDVDLSQSDKNFIIDYFPRVTGQYFKRTKCSDCFKDAIVLMNLTYNKTKQINMANTGFRLRNGVVLHSQNGNGVLSFKNLTDERAIAFIVEFSERGVDLIKNRMFSEVPKNYKDLMKTYTEKPENTTPEDAGSSASTDVKTEQAKQVPQTKKTPAKRTRSPRKRK